MCLETGWPVFVSPFHALPFLSKLLGQFDGNNVYSKLKLLTVFLPADLEDRTSLAEVEMIVWFTRNQNSVNI